MNRSWRTKTLYYDNKKYLVRFTLGKVDPGTKMRLTLWDGKHKSIPQNPGMTEQEIAITCTLKLDSIYKEHGGQK